PSRFSDGSFGVLYAGDRFEVALLEMVHHHARFMLATVQPPGWTSQFREIVLDIDVELHDLRGGGEEAAGVLDPVDYRQSQQLGGRLRDAASEGVVYPSVRCPGGECVGLFYPDGASQPMQCLHLDYHWNGEWVDLYRDRSAGEVFRIV
ncbi:MAG: RES family NAD+ phosphorylase, partial [Bosea sp. (in: a-proteobacteria)]|nr:RES family NAD+ phosphorylase [Bosea sp. (in: a-proteobacteria)]